MPSSRLTTRPLPRGLPHGQASAARVEGSESRPTAGGGPSTFLRDARWAWAPVTALAAVLAFLFLGERSLWGDEAFSVAQARLSWAELGRLIIESQGNMALFHGLLKPWIAVFGETEVAVRALSAVLAIAAVSLTYLLGRRLFGTATGVVAALLLAVNAFYLSYAQEARAYALLLLLTCALSLISLRLIHGGRPAPLAAAYAVVGALAIAAHSFAEFVVLGHVIGVLAARPSRRATGAQLVGAAGAALLSSPLVLAISSQDAGQVDWITQPGVIDVARAARDLAGGSNALLAVYAALVVLAVVAVFRRRGEERRSLTVVLAWLIVPVAAVVLFSYVAKPLFVPRYLIVCLPALVLLVGRGVALLPRWPRLASLAVILILAAFELPYLQPDYEEVDFRHATAHVLDQARAGDGIVFYRPSRRLGFEYYVRRSGRSADDLTSLHPPSRIGRFDLTADYRAHRLSAAQLDRLRTWLTSRRVWLYSSQEEVPTNRLMAARIRSTLDASGRLLETRDFTGLKVRLYVPRRSP